jgi:hypothetical protein
MAEIGAHKIDPCSQHYFVPQRSVAGLNNRWRPTVVPSSSPQFLTFHKHWYILTINDGQRWYRGWSRGPSAINDGQWIFELTLYVELVFCTFDVGLDILVMTTTKPSSPPSFSSSSSWGRFDESVWAVIYRENSIIFFWLPIISESTAPPLGAASRTDAAFYFMPGAGHHDLVPFAPAPVPKNALSNPRRSNKPITFYVALLCI